MIRSIIVIGGFFAMRKSSPSSRIFSPKQQLFSKEINPYIFIGVILFLIYYGSSKKENFEGENK